MRLVPRTPLRALCGLAGVVVALAAPGAAGAATPVCDLYVAAGGSDAAAGDIVAPFATVQHLADVAAPGQTGCLRSGTYVENLRITSPGITLTSAPGELATIRGRLRLMPGADGVTVTRLNLDGRNDQGYGSPVVVANGATFSFDDITNFHTDICFIVGSFGWSGWPDITVSGMTIAHNVIHDCGALPATNLQHGVYLENTRNLQLVDNAIYNNADRGVQLYPAAMGTTIARNIIDGNGEGIAFGGLDGVASSGTVVEHNIITGSRLRADVESWYPSGTAPGVDNVVRDNCIGDVDTSGGGFEASNSLTVAGIALPVGSTCGAVLAPATPPPAAQPPTTAQPPSPAPEPQPAAPFEVHRTYAVAASNTTAFVTAEVVAAQGDPVTVQSVTWTSDGPRWTTPARVRWQSLGAQRRRLVMRVPVARAAHSVRVRVANGRRRVERRLVVKRAR
jgi:parallel beta-helix repeat protein